MDKIMENIEKFRKISFETHKCKMAAMEHIKELLLQYKGGNVEISEIANEMSIDQIFVAYDGGYHPERDSNLFSEVENVYLDDKGVVKVETEDGEMELHNLMANEVMEIVEWLYECKEDIEKYKEEYCD